MHAAGAGSAPNEVVDAANVELDRVEYRTTLAPLLERLPERECTIIKLRFFADLPQSQSAQRIGLPQMPLPPAVPDAGPATRGASP